MRVAVLMGGTSAERDVSLVSGAAVVNGLKSAGHEVVPIDTAKGYQVLKGDDIKHLDSIKTQPPLIEELKKYAGELSIEAVKSHDLRNVDVVFVILHGGSGEDGTIQALLDLVGIPYTGSGVLASALAMNKFMAKKIFIVNDIPTPDFFIIDYKQNLSLNDIDDKIISQLNYPAIIKPVNQGSSVGLSLVKDSNGLEKALKIGFHYDSKLLFEEYISGREITVGILGDQILPLAEIIPQSGIYDYEHKYTDGRSTYICPADLPDNLADKIGSLGLKAFKALDCAGFGRVDFRLTDNGQAYCLEVNTLPGMTTHSLVPKAAKVAGIDFPKLLEKICQIALKDFKDRAIKEEEN
ncbi:MAG TPA: D-alanine--D-alanine ligase [candidate division Zixibacteria bacterium]|nr:D-alanine--D-alanine ligase [candidate division Zixibacteria bacterium]